MLPSCSEKQSPSVDITSGSPTTVKHGLRELAHRIPDVVLLDVEMPLLNGPDMAYQMFIHNCGLECIPIVLLSGIASLTDVAARVGTPYYLEKPYSLGAVLSMCERALAERIAPTPNVR